MYGNNSTHRIYSSLEANELSNDKNGSDDATEDDQIKQEHTPGGYLKMRANRGLLNVSHPAHGKDAISHLFLDEDDWEDQVNATAPQIVVKGWAPIRTFGKKGCIADQAVIYIHGYNVSLHEACSQMAHLVSFSKLPPYVLPFVFNWDGQHWGPFGAIAYHKAKRITQHPGLEESFCELLSELLGMGIKNVHIIVHSCGARVFFKVFRAAIQKGLILQVLGTDKQATTGHNYTTDKVASPSKTLPIRMDTLMLLNPDYPMERFRDHDYFLVRSYCDHIVMYVDTRDHCLTMAELFNGEVSLGMSVFAMCTTPEVLDEIVPELEASGLCLSLKNTQDVAELPFVSSYTMYKGRVALSKRNPGEGSLSIDMTPGQGSAAHKRETINNSIISPSQNYVVGNSGKISEDMQPYRLARLSEDLGVESRHLWLDMDVIDTTMIDTNVDFLKHSLYQMKREIMDDIREVILMKIRAEQRQTRLDRRRGNVFVFRVAPAAVNHLFRGS
ncbi:erythrocyte membrane protein [Babesia ovata]|uniref:Erythrocyte membrane protein n=1 Tax=Babesia ovata TaxID=189622 RepID=A0A2H6KEL4_9APIC|nr:erythrocyte membrane protein [Babesia ovata]GBE61440.1 erythrocyte membrane protein [Babesia ovata]